MKIINFATADVSLVVKNMRGATLTKQLVRHGKDNKRIDLKIFFANFPVYHTVEAFVGTRKMSVNGRQKLKIIPTSYNIEVPLYISLYGKFV